MSVTYDDWQAAGSPTFEPWEGPHYSQAPSLTAGRKLMILGESHYSWLESEIGQTPPQFTIGTMRRYPLARQQQRLFDWMAHTFVEAGIERSWRDHVIHFWNSVAFFNFVPVIADGRPSHQGGKNRVPEDWMFKAGTETFQTLIQKLEPDVVIVCGVRLWEHVAPRLRGFSGWHGEVDVYDDGQALFAKFYHPSSPSYRFDDWRDRAQLMFKLASQPRVEGRKLRWNEVLPADQDVSASALSLASGPALDPHASSQVS